jgi:tRNA(Ile)-lysidine synthase TilS/MesJ
MAKQGDIIFYKPQNDFRSVVLEDVLKFFSEKSGAKLIKIDRMINKPAKIAVPSTLDLEADKIVHAIILENAGTFSLKNKTLPIEKTGKKEIIKPLYLFLDEEILLYAGIRGLKFKKRTTKNDKLSSFISTLEKKHPEIKRAVINSWLRIQGK